MAKEATKSTRVFKKRESNFLSLKDAKPGILLEGKYLGIRKNERTDLESGETTERPQLMFQTDDGKTLVVNRNAGLVSAMQDAEIKVGETIQIEFLGKEKTKSGRQMNKYSIAVAE